MYNRTRGHCCPYCSGRICITGISDLATTNPELLDEWNYEKNDKIGLTPFNLGKGYDKKVYWKCKMGHEWSASINNRVNHHSNCPYCSNRRILKGYNDLATTNPELLEEWDYERNLSNGFTPQNVSKSCSKKLFWKCKYGHHYETYVYNKRKGFGDCPYCRMLKND